jgi:hypothetical protein
METLKTLNYVRETINSLNACKEFVVNKQKRAEIERLLVELQMLDESLVAKNPLSTLSTLSTSTDALQQMRVAMDQRKGMVLSLPAIQNEAIARGLDPNTATQSIRTMQQQEHMIQSRAFAENIAQDISAQLYGRKMSKQELTEYVQRVVTGNLQVPRELVNTVTSMVVDNF